MLLLLLNIHISWPFQGFARNGKHPGNKSCFSGLIEAVSLLCVSQGRGCLTSWGDPENKSPCGCQDLAVVGCQAEGPRTPPARSRVHASYQPLPDISHLRIPKALSGNCQYLLAKEHTRTSMQPEDPLRTMPINASKKTRDDLKDNVCL